jgi:hypothetical protein
MQAECAASILSLSKSDWKLATTGIPLRFLAEINGDNMFAESDQLNTPAAVHYGRANLPNVRLHNKDGLAASPFRTHEY